MILYSSRRLQSVMSHPCSFSRTDPAPGGALRVPAPPPGRDPQRGRQAAPELRPGADGPEGAEPMGGWQGRRCCR